MLLPKYSHFDETPLATLMEHCCVRDCSDFAASPTVCERAVIVIWLKSHSNTEGPILWNVKSLPSTVLAHSSSSAAVVLFLES